MKVTILLSVIFLFSISSMHCGAFFNSKPKLEVTDWNKKPEKNTDIRLKTFEKMKKISPDKFTSSYKYMYVGIGNLNSNMYGQAHAKDLLIMEFVNGEDIYKITVFSNEPEPDEDFFRSR